MDEPKIDEPKIDEPRIEEKAALRVVGLTAPFIHVLSPDCTAGQVIPELWDRFQAVRARIPRTAADHVIGIVWGRPEDERSHPHELQYVCGAPVDRGTDPPEGLAAHDIPAGTFACFTHRGPIQHIARTCRHIYREWLPGSEWEHSGVADIELYDDRFCPAADDSEMEYWISVRPAAE